MAAADEHVVVNVEAAIVERLHLAAVAERERADIADQVWRDRLADAAGLDDPAEVARIQRHAEQLRLQAGRLVSSAQQHEQAAQQAIARATSLDQDKLAPADVQPVTRTPVTKEWREQQAAEAAIVAWGNLRAERNRLLEGCDWRVVADAPGADKAGWLAYRQQLRDLPGNTTDPHNPSWPVPPA